MRIGFILTPVLAGLFLAGCAGTNLRNGEYRIDRSGRNDFAVVYEDLIFLHIKTPENVPGPLAYWEWAGKYKVRKNGVIELDMDHETLRRWKFNYQFLRKKNGISFNDWEQKVGQLLRYRSPTLRSDAPRPAATADGAPVGGYRDLSGSDGVK